MNTITVPALHTALLAVCQRIIESEQLLTELDTIIGDGDHGFGMRVGFTAMEKELLSHDYKTPYDLLWAAGLSLIRVMGGTSGVIFGTLFIGGLDEIKGLKELSLADFSRYLEASAEAIHRRGKVERGDKTMYDALIEASESLKESVNAGLDLVPALQLMAYAARMGVEHTRDMISQIGRSRNFRDKTLGHPDSGAVSTYLILDCLSLSFAVQK